MSLNSLNSTVQTLLQIRSSEFWLLLPFSAFCLVASLTWPGVISRCCYLSILKTLFCFILLYLCNKSKLISCSPYARLFSHIISLNIHKHPIKDCFISILQKWKLRPGRVKYKFFAFVCSLVSEDIKFLCFMSALNIFPGLVCLLLFLPTEVFMSLCCQICQTFL